jgi:hypothetical protein
MDHLSYEHLKACVKMRMGKLVLPLQYLADRVPSLRFGISEKFKIKEDANSQQIRSLPLASRRG